MKTRLLIIIAIIIPVAGFTIYTSGAFTPLQSDLSECYYTDDQSNTPQPCMIIDGWYDMLQESSLRTSSLCDAQCDDVEKLPPCTSDRTACFNQDENQCDPSGWECSSTDGIFEEIIENEN